MKARFLTMAVVALASAAVSAQNPIVRDQFSADPSALVVGDKVYVFPSHDIKAPAEYARKDWFCMADYHVFSSSNLTDWTDNGMIVDQWSAPWVNASGYSMWAPDCKQNPNNGKYYFFFPAGAKPQPSADGRRGFGGNRVGICTSDYPEGPYTPEATPIEGVGGIDPCIFVDDDGQGYLVMPGITITKLNPDWKSISTDPADRHRVEEVPTKGLVEGPYLYKHNGKYYMTFPWARDVEEVLAYCMADNILVPTSSWVSSLRSMPTIAGPTTTLSSSSRARPIFSTTTTSSRPISTRTVQCAPTVYSLSRTALFVW